MFIHLESLSTDTLHFIIRIFDDPIGPIDMSTGQPWKEFSVACVVDLNGTVAELKGVINISIEQAMAIRTMILNQLPDVEELIWWRWKDGKKKKVIYKLK